MEDDRIVFDEGRARQSAQNNLMAGEDLLRIGNYAKLRGYGKTYLILTTHRLMLVGKKSMLDFLLRDVTNVGWTKKRLVVTTVNTSVRLKGKRKWRRTYDDFLRSVREQQLGFGIGARGQAPTLTVQLQTPHVGTAMHEREVINRESVFVRCRFCGSLVAQGVPKCQTCGAEL